LQQVLRINAYAGMGMTPSELAARYREYAAQCMLLAENQENANEKLALIDMTQAWIALAELAEKNESLFVAHETPNSKRTEDA